MGYGDASSSWCQHLGECQNVSLHKQRHIPEEDRDQSVSRSKESKQSIIV